MDGINEMEDKGVIIQGLPIYNLQFADDLDLIDKDSDSLQVMLNKLCEDSEIYGCAQTMIRQTIWHFGDQCRVTGWHFQYMEPRWNMYSILYTSDSEARKHDILE